ncbi:MAG: efflux transporter outer rane subunit [Bacteroidetes bacterium]|nr:efflux transporter outer rane subunit [Bacteroidota bacterium]
MTNKKIFNYLLVVGLSLIYAGCKLPNFGRKTENKTVPQTYNGSQDSTNTARLKWQDFFTDANLTALIDTALRNSQELNIVLQEINMSRNDVRARKGAYLPVLGIGVGAGVEKVGRYTSQGANDATTDILPGKPFPEPLPDLIVGATVSWEVDIWRKLRNSRKAAMFRYLSSVQGKNFMVTNLISEIANSYYELMALDNQLEILKKNIQIQQNALEIVKLEKEAAKVTELAVRKFEAEVLKNQSRQFYIMQQITETENKINFLTGRFPQPVKRDSQTFLALNFDTIHSGIPSQLLENRPDIKQAEQQLVAAKLDVKAAKANFYPTLMITGGVGYRAFNPQYLIQTPTSLIYSIAGQLVAPLINRNAIKAEYYSANSRQIQAVYNYERTILRAHIEVVNQLSNMSNLKKSYELKTKQVQALNQSIDISTGLFKSARADYMEVLLTQRDALEARFELIETKKEQLNARVNIYRALGGGWR